ncbi:MAG TPA: ComEC/Rec2 family competence protein [Actinomycetota bacterium]
MWWPAAAAVSFGAGIVMLSSSLGRPQGAGALGAGAVLLAVSLGRRTRALALLRERGLLPPLGERERILLAAGFAPPAPRRRRAKVAALLAVFVLGVGWGALRTSASPPPFDGRWVSFSGVAAQDPRGFEFGWGAEAVVSLAPAGSSPAGPFRVWLSEEGPPARFVAGSRLEGAGLFHPLGPSSFERFLASRGVAGIVSVGRLSAAPPSGLPLRVAAAVREGLARGAFRALPRRDAGLVLGLLIGRTDAIDPELARDLRASGLGHLVAVSGANVAMILGPVLAAAALLRLGRRARLVVGLLVVALFTLVTRWEPSVLRAAAMASLALFAVAAGRRRDAAGLLGVACLALLVADPRLATSLGFRLSAAATAGILAFGGRVADRLGRLPRPVALAVGATVGAQAAVTPLLLLTFGSVPTAALVANVLALPAVGPAFLLGAAAAGLALLWPPAGVAVGAVARIPIAYLAAVADRGARLPAPTLVGAWWVLPVLAAAAAVVLLRRARPRVRLGLLATGTPIVLVAALVGPAPGGDALEVVFLDVGQGDAAVVRTPEGGTVLIDAGPDRDLVATRLAALGIRRIDLAVATHAHADHVAGFPEVLSRHPVGLLLEPGCPGDSPAYRDLLAAAASEGVPVRHPRGGELLRLGDLFLEVLGPDECAVDSPNDDSIVLRVTYRGGAVLFPGDAEVPAQQDLLDDGDAVSAVLLKVPHHGGATSDPAFFEAVGARLAVVSVGENDYGHPAPEMLDALRAAGSGVVRTDLSGDIRVLVRGTSLELAAAA